jgi:hypothetical protein
MKNYLKRCTLILSVILLVSCSKPPGCASEDALQGIRNDLVAIDGTKDSWTNYFQSLKFALETVTSEGYNSNSKSYSCHATLKIQEGDKPIYDNRIDYTIQTVESKDKAYEVTIDDTVIIMANLRGFYSARLDKEEANSKTFVANIDNFKLPINDVANLKGKDAGSILSVPRFKLVVDTVWRKYPDAIENRLTKSLAAIEDTGQYFAGWGCMNSKCDTERVLWAVKKDTGMPLVLVTFKDSKTGQGGFTSMGMETVNGAPQIPLEIQSWLKAQIDKNHNSQVPMSVPAAGQPAQPESATAVTPTDKLPANLKAKVDACFNTKAEVFHKERGEDVPVNYDQIQEWEDQCRNQLKI